MAEINAIYEKINEDMLKVQALEDKKEYDSAITILKDQITFLDGYLTGVKDPIVIQILHSILRDRRILIRVMKVTRHTDVLEKSTDERIANLVYKISQLENELQIKKEGT